MNTNTNGGTFVVSVLVVALLARVLLSWQNSQEWLGRRIEISTPVNQWMRGSDTFHSSLFIVAACGTTLYLGRQIVYVTTLRERLYIQ